MFQWYLQYGAHDTQGNMTGALQMSKQEPIPTDISSMPDDVKDKVIANAVDFLALNW